MDGDSTPTPGGPPNEAPQVPSLGIQKSCADCSHLRLRCVRDPAGGSCYRCIRHNRPCRARERKTRPGPKPKPPPAHIADLEAKVANLANILANQRRAMPELGSLEPDELEEGSQSPIQSSSSSTAEISAEPRGPVRLTFPPPPPIVSYQTYVLRNQERLSQLGQPPPPDLKVNYDAADLLLGKFQTVMTGYFPFVVIPAGINALWLQQAKPFLFMCVIGLSSQQSVLQQESMTLAIMKYLSHHMFFAGVKNLDLLQGLLVYISWYHIHQQSQNNNQITNLLQMAISLLVDLGLNKAPRQTETQTAVDNSYRSAPDIPGVRTKDERRALLGCFYLTSVISSTFKKMEAMRYNSHVDESYKVITASPEYRSDLYLVHLVRLQHFAENVTQSLPYDLPERTWEMRPPIGMFIQSYQAELKIFTDYVPAELRTSSSLQIHIQSNEIHLYEIALCEGAGHATYGSFALGRTDILHSCMLSAKQLITSFLELPIVEYRNFPFVMWVQTMHAILVLSKLSTLKDPGWDLIYVRSVIHFSKILDQFLVKFQLAKDAEDPYHQPMCRWNAYAQRIQRLKMWYESKLVTPRPAQSGTAASPIPVLDDHPFNRTGPENPEVPAIQYNFGELDDDTFWRDIMGDWSSL